MPEPIEFWFDFSSPYAYFASFRIDEIAARHGRAVDWRPFLLGVVFKTTGQGPLTHSTMRGRYAQHDWVRLARRMKVPYTMPESFPLRAQAASRAFYWLDERDPAKARQLAHAIWKAFFGEGRDMTPPDAVAEVAAGLGLDKAALLAGIESPAIKERLKTETERGMARGVFGSPFFLIDGEGFWGNDRLDEIDAWLSAGGW
ncbi:MAG: 2-hydroxychromene-2-carboxylate isomerase [Alphaproteobacteria bacterium]|nr:2-hydroxychromene-2-carboxylate isomerase [Alphaproteobacteria bacterium]